MSLKATNHKRSALLSCSVLIIIAIMGVMALIGWVAREIRDEAHYPGAVVERGHTNTALNATYIRLDQAFITDDDLVSVHSWYEDQFDLNVMDQTDDCVVLDGSKEDRFISQMTFISMCSMPSGQIVYITRIISRR